MSTVSIRKNFSVVTHLDGVRTIKVANRPIGHWDRHAEQDFQNAIRVLGHLHCGDEAWVDETHHATFPGGDTANLRYGRELTLGGVGERHQSTHAYERGRKTGRLIRPSIPVGGYEEDVLQKLGLSTEVDYITTKRSSLLPKGALVQPQDFGPEDTGRLVEVHVHHPDSDWNQLVLGEKELREMGLKPHPDYN